jgi:hypothetical protein
MPPAPELGRLPPRPLAGAWLAVRRWLRRAAWLLVGIAAWPTAAWAGCPQGEPCETVVVDRVQSWPVVLADSLGRDILSLQEANASDEKALLASVASLAKGTSLLIRYTVTRIATAPNGYCNCNLEREGKGCPSSLPAAALSQCTRVCRYQGGACLVAGVDTKEGGGRWFAFPAATQHPGGKEPPWSKNLFGQPVANARDWTESSRTVKRAACVVKALKDPATPSLDAVFASQTPCEALTKETLEAEAKR